MLAQFRTSLCDDGGVVVVVVVDDDVIVQFRGR